MRWGLMFTSLALVLLMFRASVATTVETWLETDEYNYGPIVPVIAGLMIWRDLRRAGQPATVGWFGAGLVAVGTLLGFFELLTHTRFIGQFALFVTLIGVIGFWIGTRNARVCWPGLIFLFFAMPLPGFLQVQLTSALQLVSSQGAVGILRALGTVVLREGNTINLGAISLEVAEACSGLRYLYPLSCFAFLCSYLFIASPLSRAILFAASVPITVGMNIARIAIAGLLVNEFGVGLAEGFFHSFEGWIIYCLCLAILFGIMKLICLIDGRGRSVSKRLDLQWPKQLSRLQVESESSTRKLGMKVALFAFLLIGVAVGPVIGNRSEPDLSRQSFAMFPREISGWVGFDAPIDVDSFKTLSATDYLSTNYARPDGGLINVWVAYYDQQYSGKAVHSPQVCVPGGGWSIESLDKRRIAINAASDMHEVNRLIIRKGNSRALMYYWFLEGGHVVADETEAKVQLLLNSFKSNRRDGALVRFVTEIGGIDDAESEARLQAFITEISPLMAGYLPQ